MRIYIAVEYFNSVVIPWSLYYFHGVFFSGERGDERNREPGVPLPPQSLPTHDTALFNLDICLTIMNTVLDVVRIQQKLDTYIELGTKHKHVSLTSPLTRVC